MFFVLIFQERLYKMAFKTKLSLSSLPFRRKKRTDNIPPPNLETISKSDTESPSKVTGLRRWMDRQPRTSHTSSDSTALPSATTGDTGTKSDQDIVANGSITKATVQNAQTQQSLDPKAPSGDFWDRAYQLLREDQSQKSSLKKYEHILALEFGGQHQSPTASGGLTSSDKEKLLGMVAKKLERMEDEPWRIKVGDTSIELRPQFNRFVNAVIAVKDFVSAAVSSEPHATLAWAGVCIVLPLLINPTTQQKALIEGVDHISTVIVRSAVLDRLYHDRTPSPTKKDMIDLTKLFERQTIKLYSQILSYQAHVICQLARATALQVSRDVIKADDWAVKITEMKASEAAAQETFRLLGLETADKALEEQGQQMHKGLEDHHQRMIKLYQQLESNKNNESADLLAWKQTAEESKCLQALCTNASTYEDTKNRNRQRVPNTCRWFLENQIFRNWYEDRSSALLWVTADPGCGKSVLSRSLVDNELGSTDTSTTAYFFFKEDSPETRSVLSAISALLHQLGSQSRTLLSTIVAHYQQKGSQIFRSFSWLWNLLLKTISELETGRVVCVLDALDECEDTERALLIDALDSLRQAGNGQLKFLVTSRPYSSIEERFDQSTIRLAGENESENLKDEIDMVIEDKVADIAKRKRLNQKTQDRLQERLIKTENRTYLWLHLVLQGLEKTLIKNSSDVDREIDQLFSLDDAYEAILNRSPRPEQAQRTLHIVVAAVRPLTIHEMNIAFNIKRDDKCLEAMDLDPEDALISNIKNICGLFVSVHNSQVYLLHQTAKDFLIRPSRPETGLRGASPSVIQGDNSYYRLPRSYLHDDALEGNLVLGQTTRKRPQLATTVTSDVRIWKYSLDPVESHHVLAEICLAYLLFDSRDEIDITDDDTSSPSTVSLDAAEIDRSSRSDEFDNEDRPSSLNAEQGSLSASSGQTSLDEPKKSAEVNSLSVRSLSPLSDCPTRATWMTDTLSEHRDLLQYASRNWALHYEVARQDNNLQAMWLSFCTPGSPKLAEWGFIQEGYVPEFPANISQLALASSFRHNRMVSYFLNANVDIESRDSHGYTPLIWAVTHGNETTVDLLLASGALINYMNLSGRTPLWFAAKDGEDKIAEKLIHGGAFLNPELRLESLGSDQKSDDMDPTWSSPLAAVVTELLVNSLFAKFREANYMNVIRLLLDRGAVVDSGTRQASPLWLSLEASVKSDHGQELIVKLLLSRGADVNFQDTETGWSPLHRAVACVNRQMIPMLELILKGKPNLDVQDFRGETPLHAAFDWGSENNVDTVVQLLLNAGGDPNISSDKGIALHSAAKRGRLGCVEQLLTAGADANAKDCKGRMSLGLAQEELEYEQRIKKQLPNKYSSLRKLEGLMKVVELLKSITTGSDGTHRDTPQYQFSQSDSSPSVSAVHPADNPDFEPIETRGSSPSATSAPLLS